MEVINMKKLTKAEQYFLLDWLQEDLDLAYETESLNDWGKNNLKSIIKKLSHIPKDHCKDCGELMKMDEVSSKNKNYCISCN
jgi:formylmethanofuran dehydrogenase subunit E